MKNLRMTGLAAAIFAVSLAGYTNAQTSDVDRSTRSATTEGATTERGITQGSRSAQDDLDYRNEIRNERSTANRGDRDAADRQDNLHRAQEHVSEAAQVVKKMKGDAELAKLLSEAKGVFVVPNYGRGAAIIGGEGGGGVMMARVDDGWSQPAFYNVGGISIGAQVGAEAGAIVMLLMNDKAIESFKQNNNFSVDADAGLTVINFSARGEASAGKGDVVVWADTDGLMADLAIGVQNISWDEDENEAYHGQKVTPSAILSGTSRGAQQRQQQRNELQDALS